MYIKRDIEKTLIDAAKTFQIITIYGSRQVGKTTTADILFGSSFNFVTLDDPDDLSLALENPKGFLEVHQWPLIIDEVQKAPGLLNVIKMIVDEKIRKWMRNNEERKFLWNQRRQRIAVILRIEMFRCMSRKGRRSLSVQQNAREQKG